MNNTPKCENTYSVIGSTCPPVIFLSDTISPKEIVKISCNGGIFNNGVWDMAQNLMHVTHAKYSHYNHETKQYEQDTYDCLILDFKNNYSSDFDEQFYMDPRQGYYTEEDIDKWRETQRVVFPPIHVYSLKASCIDDELVIEIETDNAYEVRKLFYLFADLGNGGHSFGGLVRNSDDDYNVGSFGFDGDGCDNIHKIDEDDDL